MIDQLDSVIIAEDDSDLASELAESLGQHEFTTRLAPNWATLMQQLADQPPDIIVLDQGLANVDSVNRLAQLRQETDCIVVILTGRQSESDRILALERGADDFLIKPISGRELAARLRAHLRRAGAGATAPVEVKQNSQWRLDSQERRLYRPDGSVLPLTASEFRLLEVLAQTPGKAISRTRLLEDVFGRAPHDHDRSLNSIVYLLRRKLGPRRNGRCIEALRSQGYTFIGFPDT